MASHPDAALVARCVLAVNRLFRMAMRMLVVHPVTGRPAPTPTPPRVAQMWTQLAKLRAMLQQRLVDTKSPSALRRAIIRLLCTIVFSFSERSKESTLRVASAGSRSAAVVLNGPDTFCLSDVPQAHPALQRRELGGIAQALVASLSSALSGAAAATWDDASLCFLVAQLSWVATARPELLPTVAQTLASLVQSPTEGLRPTVSQARDSLSRRLRPAVALSVRAALVRLMKRAAAAAFTADLGACLYVMGDEQRPEPLAHAVRARIDFKVVEQLRAMAPPPRPDQEQAHTDSFDGDAFMDSYAAPNDSALFDLGDEYAPPPTAGSGTSSRGAAAHAPGKQDPRMQHASDAGGDPRSAAGQRSAATEQHSCFKTAAPKLPADALRRLGDSAFQRLMKPGGSVQWSASALHCLEGLSAIHQLVSWAVDPLAAARGADALAVCCAAPHSLAALEAQLEIRTERCTQVMQRVCEDYVDRADVGARLLSALWLASRGLPAGEGGGLLGDLTQQFLSAAAVDSPNSKLSPTLVVDVACALPYDCLRCVLGVAEELLQSSQPALLASAFRILDAYRQRRPQHDARVVQFYLCVAHTASNEGAQATAIKALQGAKAHTPYITQFATTAAMSVARPAGAAGRGVEGWQDHRSLLFPHAPEEELTALEAAAAESFAGGVADVHDARRRVGPFFRLCARQHALLACVPWLYCNAAGGEGGEGETQTLLAEAVRKAITTTPLWLHTLRLLKKKHAVHDVLAKLCLEAGLPSVVEGNQLSTGADSSVQLPCSEMATCAVQQLPSFVPFVIHVLQVCTDGLAPEPAAQHVGQWGGSLLSPLPVASIPAEVIQSVLQIGSRAGGETPLVAELRVLQPLLRFLPPADLLALLPHYLQHMTHMDMPVHEFLRTYLQPGSPLSSLDAAFMLAWILQCCAAKMPAQISIWDPPGSTHSTPTLQDAARAAEGSTFFARYGAADVLPLSTAAKDVQGLLTVHGTFDAPMIWSGLGLLAATQPPPKLLMFWFLSAREASNTDVMSKQLCALLGSLVQRASLHGDASAALWDDDNTWKGFRKFVLSTIPASLPVIVRLPVVELEKLLASNPKLKMRLDTFLQSPVNQTGLQEAVLSFFGILSPPPPASGAAASPEAQRPAAAGPQSQEARVGGRKRSAAPLQDSRSSLRPRSE